MDFRSSFSIISFHLIAKVYFRWQNFNFDWPLSATVRKGFKTKKHEKSYFFYHTDITLNMELDSSIKKEKWKVSCLYLWTVDCLYFLRCWAICVCNFCFRISGIMHFKINLSFLIQSFSYVTKKPGQNFNCFNNKNSLE